MRIPLINRLLSPWRDRQGRQVQLADRKAFATDSHHWPSRFGGLWTDRSDANTQLECRRTANEWPDALAGQVRDFMENGFCILPGVIGEDLVDRCEAEITALKQRRDTPLRFTSASNADARPWRPDAEASHRSVRLVDEYILCAASRDILLHPAIGAVLSAVFDTPPLLTQSLRFQHGSQQALHRDTAFVQMSSPNRFAAAWVALEDVTEGSGELVYSPGSHRWPDYEFDTDHLAWHARRDGQRGLDAFHDWIRERAEQAERPLERFLPRRGDVLLWHPGLVHGGSPIRTDGATRLSLVGHYCPQDVRPLYHWHRPASRNIRAGDDGWATSWHYP